MPRNYFGCFILNAVKRDINLLYKLMFNILNIIVNFNIKKELSLNI